jgi:hypothetical protein
MPPGLYVGLSSGNVGIGTTGIAGTSNAVNLTTSGAAGAITVLANGNVGIGTTTPITKLHIIGNINTLGALYSLKGTLSIANSGTATINTSNLVDGVYLCSILNYSNSVWRILAMYTKNNGSQSTWNNIIASVLAVNTSTYTSVVVTNSDTTFSINVNYSFICINSLI